MISANLSWLRSKWSWLIAGLIGLLRYLILRAIYLLDENWVIKLKARALITEIGATGHVLVEVDNQVAETNGLKRLNFFQRWCLRPYIESETVRRREEFQYILVESSKFRSG